MTLKEKVNQAFELLQMMDIKTTKTNVEAISYSLIVLQEVYQKLDEGGEENGTV